MSCLEQALEWADKYRAGILAQAGSALEADRLLAEYPGVVTGAGVDSTEATVDAYGLMELKLILPVLSDLRGRGWKLRKVLDEAERRSRLYRLERENGLRISVRAWLAQDASCKFEVVGTKEVPVYKLKCPDGAEAANTLPEPIPEERPDEVMS